MLGPEEDGLSVEVTAQIKTICDEFSKSHVAQQLTYDSVRERFKRILQEFWSHLQKNQMQALSKTFLSFSYLNKLLNWIVSSWNTPLGSKLNELFPGQTIPKDLLGKTTFNDSKLKHHATIGQAYRDFVLSPRLVQDVNLLFQNISNMLPCHLCLNLENSTRCVDCLELLCLKFQLDVERNEYSSSCFFEFLVFSPS